MMRAPFESAAREPSLGAAALVATALCAQAIAHEGPARDGPGPRSVERAGAAPGYLAPPGTYITGPFAPSQLYFYSLPGPFLPPAPVAPGAKGAAQPAAWDAQPPVGHVVLVVHPVSADVVLDGVRLTRRADLSYAAGLLEGRHVVRVSADGFEPHERTLDVKRGVGMFFAVRLAALPEGAR